MIYLIFAKQNTLFFLNTMKKKNRKKHNNSKVEKAFELLQLVISFRWYEMFIGTSLAMANRKIRTQTNKQHFFRSCCFSFMANINLNYYCA